jgi:hypothetical protein
MSAYGSRAAFRTEFPPRDLGRPVTMDGMGIPADADVGSRGAPVLEP